jgi:endo-1,4-beta-xylanase
MPGSRIFFSLLIFVFATSAQAERTQGIFYNEDDTHRFLLSPTGELTQAHLDQLVDELAETHVKVLVICCCAKRTNFDSKAWEPYWDGFDPSADTNHPFFGDVPLQDRGIFQQWVANMYALFKAGVDSNGCMIERSRKHGISPWISIRMNDVHDAHLGRSPLHSRFWMEHHELWRYPDRFNAWNDRCFDYGKQEVRDHAMALIREVLTRYDMDGLELDWNRFPLHFKEGEEVEQGKVLTGWMAEVRQEIKQAEKRWKHPIQLVVRVPARPEVSLGTGLDAVTWARQGLIDHLIVCPFWATTDFDIPVEEWHSLLKGTGVEITAGLEALVRSHPAARAFTNTDDTLRGAAASMLARGSEGIYLFNPFDVPKASKGLLVELDSLPSLLSQYRTHVLTYTDISIPGQPIPAQLPRTLAASESAEFRIHLAPMLDPTLALLRLGFNSSTDPSSQLKVSLQNQECPWFSGKGVYKVPSKAVSNGHNTIIVMNHGSTPVEIDSLRVEMIPLLPEEEILSGAKDRIEKYRMGDAVILLIDQDGKPVPGARVKIEQIHHDFLFGCNNYLSGDFDSREKEDLLRDRFSALFNYATLPFYWWSYEPVPGQTREAHTREVAHWCRERGIRLKGHPLAWNFSEPAWLPDSTEEVKNLQMQRIEDCMKAFAGLIDTWDVVNEATAFDREECVAQAPKVSAAWSGMGRIEFTQECFKRARAANPGATLLINDYRTGEDYVNLIHHLTDDQGQRLYDIIGIQSHMHGEGVWPATQTWEILQRFARLGAPLHFTETTVVSGKQGYDLAKKEGAWPSTPEGEIFQAEAVKQFYTILFSHPSVEAITWWDIADYHAWMQAPAGLLDLNLEPKPAYKVLESLIKQDWWTRRFLRSDADGKAGFRGFYGDYTVEVQLPGGSINHSDFHLVKGGPNQLSIQVNRPHPSSQPRKPSASRSRFNPYPWPGGWYPSISHGLAPGWTEYRSGNRGPAREH